MRVIKHLLLFIISSNYDENICNCKTEWCRIFMRFLLEMLGAFIFYIIAIIYVLSLMLEY